MQQTTRRDRLDVEADLMHARAAREAAVGRHDVESLADMTAWIDQLRVELATLVPAQRRV